VRSFMKSILLLIAIAGLCLCAVQAAPPASTWGAAAQTVKTPSSPSVSQTTLPTVAGLSADTTSTIVSKAATSVRTPTRTPTATATSPTVRTTAPRPATTAPTTAAPSARAVTPRPTPKPTTAAPADLNTTAPASTQTADLNLTAPWPVESPNATLPTPWPYATTFEVLYPTEDRTPDIDPGMTPYSGPTPFETIEQTPTWEEPPTMLDATPTDPAVMIPYFTAEVVQSGPFELPPGAYGVEQLPSPTETMVPVPLSGPGDAGGSSFLPRWLSYLLFIFIGVSGVAGLALVGSYLGSRSAVEPVGRAVTPSSLQPRAREIRLLQPGTGELTADLQAMVDLIAGFAPQSMHVERLGRHLLRFEHGAQMDAQDRSVRFSRLLVLSAIPSAPVPAPATVWARTHGFRVLAVDGFGMALVMAALSNGGRSTLGVLPVREMVEGASPAPMAVLFTESERAGAVRPISHEEKGRRPAGDAADGT
jgi:hypothetical protein